MTLASVKNKSQVVFVDEIPDFSTFSAQTLVIYDQVLPKVSKNFKKKLKTATYSYAVKGGETLKDISNFPIHISRIVKVCEQASVKQFTIVVVGGGSVGDFGGFVASVYKRGVSLVQIPTTWLAAIDSAHGGKTALNVADAKNQIGTFYPAQQIILCQELLFSQPSVRSFEAFAELYKIALISGGKLWKQFSQENQVSAETLWKYLRPAVEAKYKVVRRDPEEKKGYRQVLNLGHTVGHVFEVLHQMPHGIAVNYGLRFCLEYSLEQGMLSLKHYQAILEAPASRYLLSPTLDKLLLTKKSYLQKVEKLLFKDKKRSQASSVRFVFLNSPGKTLINDVQIKDLLLEWVRQAKSLDEKN